MKLIKVFFILFAGMLMTGCSKVIDIKLPSAPPKLVIDASIDWMKNTSGNEQKIIISRTAAYYDTEVPGVSGAVVKISNSFNTVFDFIEGSRAGEYVCNNFAPVVGETYRLTVVVNDITYTATETLTATPDFDGDITQTDKGGMTGDEYEIQFAFLDDPLHDNYYMSGVKSSRIAFPQFELESDEMYQGNRMIEFYSHEDLGAGDSLDIKLYGVSKRFFDYFTKILTASGNNDSPFPTLPTQVKGNIINQSNVNDYPLGYFRLSQVVSRGYVIK